MGMYTELSIGVLFKPDTPIQIIDIITKMTIADGPFQPELDHPLFKTERWWWMLQSGGSYYFDAQPFCIWKYNKIGKNWCLTFISNIKNYTSEWEQFIDFIAPYLESGGYIGTYRYEEDNLPTLLWSKNGKIKMIKPKFYNLNDLED